MKISVIGLGKLGLPFAFFLASHGNKILCYDNNKKILDSIEKKRSPFVEPYLEKYIKKYRKNVEIYERLDDLINKTNVTFLVLPTPSQKDGSFSNQYILNVLKKIGKCLKNKRNKKHLINITSTLSPYSCEKILIPFLEKYNLKNEKDFLISYNPHFIAQGTTIYNLNNPDILLIGTNSSKAKEILINIYKKIYSKRNVFKILNLLESEITKLSINTFITNKISFANYISELSENSENTNASKILDVIGQDKRIGHAYMKVGTRFSGPCFPRDNKALANFASKIGITNDLPRVVDKINNRQTLRLIKIIKYLKGKFKKRINIGILGLSYKKDTDIIYDSQSYDLISKLSLSKIGISNIFVFDRFIKDFSIYKNNNLVSINKKLFDTVKYSDILFIMYKDNYFLKLKYIKPKKTKIIVDCWGLFDHIQKPFKIYNFGVNYKINNV
jgi:UDPglucose 6-dehydrogenase